MPKSTTRRPRWRLALALLVLGGVAATALLPASSEVVSDALPAIGDAAIATPEDLEQAVEAVADLVEIAATRDAAGLLAGHVDAFARRAGLRARPPADRVEVPLPADRDLAELLRGWGLDRAELAALNPGVDVANAPPGTPLLVWQREPGARATSIGRPNRGRLRDARAMPPGTGWVVRHPRLAMGAEQTIEGLIDAMRVTLAEHPKGQDLLIADISTARGGRMRPHRSHQSGRDVDVTYFRQTLEAPTFSRTRPAELDAERTWSFVRALVTRHDVEYIFMEPSLQRALYAHAESIGEHPAFLAELFERSPRGGRNNRAPIRNARGHDDHMHIRFACSADDVRCGRAH